MADEQRKKLVWITGSSTGIGAGAAKELVRRGYRVAGTARSEDKLSQLAEELGTDFYSYPGDVTDSAQMQSVVDEIENTHGPIDCVLLNAGSAQLEEGGFSSENFEWHFKVNVFGTGRALEPVLNRMVERKSGHVAIVASVAGYRGLPRSLSYGPTKAALINFAEALNITMAAHNIKVQVINPGFVDTPLTRKNDFHMPMLMPVEKAAEALVNGLESRRFEITFPKTFALMLKFIGALPDPLYFWMVRKGLERAMAQKD